MEKEFVKYDEAFELKELGFDEPCFAVFYSKEKPTNYSKKNGIKNSEQPGKIFKCTSPTYQQAFKFFREKFDLYHNILNRKINTKPIDEQHYGFVYNISIEYLCIVGREEDGFWDNYYPTYEQAEDECLKMLIQIAKFK